MAKQWSGAELHYASTQRAAGVELKVIAQRMPGRSWRGVKEKLEYEAQQNQKPARAKRRYPIHIWADADDLVAAKAQLRVEIAAARAAWRDTPLYKPAAS